MIRGEAALNELAQLAFEAGYILESITISTHAPNAWTTLQSLNVYDTDFGAVQIIKETK